MIDNLEKDKFTEHHQLERAEEIAQIGHWEIDLNTNKVKGSKGALRIYGFTKKIASLEEIQSLPLPEFRPHLNNLLKNLIERNEPYDTIFKIERQNDGEIRYIHSVAQFDQKQNIVFGVIHDITDKKNIEDRVKELDNDIRFITDNTSDVIWTMDLKGDIKYVSPSIYKLRGFRQEEVIGKNFREIVTPQSEKVAKQLLENFITEMQSAKLQNEPIVGIFEQPTADGKTIWNESVINPIFDDKGEFKMFLGVSRNITDRINAEKAIIAREQELMTAIEATGLGLWDQDFEKNIIHRNLNWYKMLGYKESEVSQKMEGWKSLIHPDDLAKAMEIAKTHEDGKSEFFSVEHRMKAKSGEWLWIHNWGKIIKRDKSGKPLRAIGVHLNNTEKKNAEKELLEKTQKYESLYQNIPVALFRSTPAGNIISCNKKAVEMYEFDSIDEFLNQPALEFYANSENRNYMLEQVRTYGELKAHATHEKKKDGSDIWVKTDYKGIFDNEGNLIYIDCLADDITDKKKAEDALIESEERYRMLVEKSPDGIAIHRNGKIVFINDSAVKLLGGIDKEQFIYKSIIDYVKDESKPSITTKFNSFLESNEESIPIEVVFVQLNGHEVPVEIHANQIEYQGGKAIQIIARDITDRIKSRTVLLENEAMYKAITENFHKGIISIVDRSGNFTFIEGQNIQEIGLGNVEIIGKNYKNVLPAKIITIIHSVSAKVLKGHQASFEVELNGKFYTNSMVPIMDTDGQIEKIITITTDISERKISEQMEKEMFAKLEGEVQYKMNELNEQAGRLKESQRALTFLLEDVNDARNELVQANKNLEAANNDLEAFAYSVSHDLRAPLRHIDGFSQLLENLIKDRTPDAEKYFKKIHESSGRMHNLINDLLSFSRLGRKKLVISNIDLQSLINEVIKNYEPDLTGRNVEWEIKELPIIRGDLELIKIVMDNLISNALKFTSKNNKTHIEIGTSDIQENQIGIYIKDNGVGFDNNYAHKMFGVFERLHNNQDFPGTGIGLANVKRIIRSHKGTIRGEGKLNEGATFFITLPINL
ncbi:MAG TPA: PAS domain S-box protein [Bacteroidales bacterium]|nr:PAS domain S-box protein [Bacteroidales bacterium]